MLCENVDILRILSDQADIRILRGNYDVKVVFMRKFVNALRKAEHTLAPHETLRSDLKERSANVIITKHPYASQFLNSDAEDGTEVTDLRTIITITDDIVLTGDVLCEAIDIRNGDLKR